ncbi:MAG: hypothetical protein ACTSPP_12120 [Candidatus Heimdallarchaeaceae archaeon]
MLKSQKYLDTVGYQYFLIKGLEKGTVIKSTEVINDISGYYHREEKYYVFYDGHWIRVEEQ